MSNWHNAVCPHDCPSACALQVEKLDDYHIGKVRGAAHQPYTDGVICAKVSKYHERCHDPERLTQPLIRTSSKQDQPRFEPIDWDAALDLVADKFHAAEQGFGKESIWPYFYGGTMGLIQRDSIIGLANSMGYSGLKATFCVQIAYDGWQAGTGALMGSDPREMAEADLIIMWGCNAAATQINAMHHVSKARKKGAKLIVIDPYQNPTAKIADLHLKPRPGTDGALACGIMHALFRDGHADRGYLQKYTDDPIGFEEHLNDKTVSWAASITGVAPEEIEQFADWYGKTKKSYIRLGIGFSRHRNGAVNVHAVSCLPAVTGAWLHKGGGALLSTGDSFKFHDELIKATSQQKPDTRILDLSLLGPILCGDKTALQGGPPVKAMLIQNTNPALVAPDLAAVRKGMTRDDLFVCVHEQFHTETTALADLVLPATMFMEHDDLYRSYGQTFMQYGGKVIEGPGQCRSNHEVISALAKRLGANHDSFTLSPNEIIDHCLAASNYPAKEQFEHQHFIDCAPDFDTMHYRNGFRWPDKKFRFNPDWAAVGIQGTHMPTKPDHWPVTDEVTDNKPLKLVAAPSRGYLNSTFNRSPSSIKREKKPQLKIHPDTAKLHGLVDNALVHIGNEKGQVTVTTKFMQDIHADTVVMEGIWPASAFPENIGINVLISAEPAAPNGGAVFHDTSVWVKAI